MLDDLDGTEVQAGGADGDGFLGLEDRHVEVGAGLRVLVGVVGRGPRGAVVEVESLHAVLPPLMEVHRAGMDEREGARLVDRADERGVVGVDDADLRRAAGP